MFLFSIFVLFLSCSDSNEHGINIKNKKNIDTNLSIEIIQIQFWPSFHSPSILTYTKSDSLILFHRIGTRLQIDPISENLKTISPPKSLCFKLNTTSTIYLQDSILNMFNESDYMNPELPECLVTDGILTNVLFAFNNHRIVDIELNNFGTQKQLKLISNFMHLCIENEIDSMNREFLIRLLKYY